MKRLIIPFLVFGLLTGCSAPQQEDNEITVIYKRQLYETIYEWAAYRQMAIIAYSALHKVSQEKATVVIDGLMVQAKREQFETWYQKQRAKRKI